MAAVTALFREERNYVGVAIAGQSGVGKSRLAREVVATATQAGWAVRCAAGTVTAQSIPLSAFAPWTDGSDGSPLQLVHHVISSMTAEAGGAPLLVVLDDAHLLDDLSAFVLHQLVLRGAATVIVTMRSGQPAPNAVTALWKDGHLRRLELKPLSRLESHTLAEAVLGGSIDESCDDELWRYTRGNVLFLKQLIEQEVGANRMVCRDGRWGWTGKVVVSPGLNDLVELQIGLVDNSVRDAVDLVAVAEPLERECLRELVPTEVIEEAEVRGLLTVSASQGHELVHVGHPLYGKARVAQMGSLRVRRLKGTVAQMLKHIDATTPVDPVRLGLLWLASDLEPDRHVLHRATEAALARFDPALADKLTRAALEVADDPRMLVWRAHALTLLGNSDDAEAILERLCAQDLPDDLMTEIARLRALNLLWPLRNPDASWEVIDDALRGASVVLTHRLRAARMLQLAVAARPQDAVVLAESIDRAALTMSDALVMAGAEVIAYGDMGHVQSAAAAATEGCRLAQGSLEVDYGALCFNGFWVSAMLVNGLIEQAGTVAGTALRQYTGAPGVRRTLLVGSAGLAALGSGMLETAVGHLRSAVSDFAGIDESPGACYRFMIGYAEAVARMGDVDGARQAIERMEATRHPSYSYLESDRLLATAWAVAASGHLTRARKITCSAAEYARAHNQTGREVWCLQTALQFGDRTLADRSAAAAATVDGPRADAVARYARALADDDAVALAQVSLDFEAIGDLLAAMDASAQASLLHLQEGRRGAALTASGRAHRLAEACSAVSPALLAATSPVTLSPREREIVTLVSHGLSNRSIAEAITASVRTVEGHLYRVMSRLGVRNRAELATLIRECEAGSSVCELRLPVSNQTG